jgi:hypothetical protein
MVLLVHEKMNGNLIPPLIYCVIGHQYRPLQGIRTPKEEAENTAINEKYQS